MINKYNPPILTKLEVEIDGEKRLILANNNRLFSWAELNDIEFFIRKTKDAYVEFSVDDEYVDRKNEEWLAEVYGNYPRPPKETLNLPIKKSGFVYLFKSLKNGWYKIGVTNSLETRLKQIIDRCGATEIVYSHESQDCYALEKEMHQYWREKLAFGEWFELTTEDVETFKNWKP